MLVALVVIVALAVRVLLPPFCIAVAGAFNFVPSEWVELNEPLPRIIASTSRRGGEAGSATAVKCAATAGRDEEGQGKH